MVFLSIRTAGLYRIAELLVNAGANVNAVDKRLNTPLHLAANGGSDEHYLIAELLLRRGANVNARNPDNATPLDVARNQKSNFYSFIDKKMRFILMIVSFFTK